MHDFDLEDGLARLAELPDEEGEAVPEAQLERYRLGELSAEEVEAVERGLAASSLSRARLAELGGIRPRQLPPRLKERVLARLKSPAPVVPTRPVALWPRLRWWAAAATVVFALVGSCLILPRLQRQQIAELPEYELSATGLASERSSAVGSTRITATPETRLVLDIAARGEATPGVELALVRREKDRLVEVPLAGEIRVEAGVGAWRLTAPALELVGGEPGERQVWIVLSRQGTAPSVEELATHSAGEELAAAGRRVLLLTVDLRATVDATTHREGEPR